MGSVNLAAGIPHGGFSHSTGRTKSANNRMERSPSYCGCIRSADVCHQPALLISHLDPEWVMSTFGRRPKHRVNVTPLGGDLVDNKTLQRYRKRSDLAMKDRRPRLEFTSYATKCLPTGLELLSLEIPNGNWAFPEARPISRKRPGIESGKAVGRHFGGGRREGRSPRDTWRDSKHGKIWLDWGASIPLLSNATNAISSKPG
jgi:hypothetical protein